MILSEPYRYPVHSWLLTVGVIFPVLMTVYESIDHKLNLDILVVSLFIVPFVFPIFAAVFLVHLMLIRGNLPIWISKLILNIVGIAGVLVIMRSIHRTDIINHISILMSASIVLSSLLIKWRKAVILS